MENKYSNISNQDKPVTYMGGWEKIHSNPNLAPLLSELNEEDIASLDYAFNLADVNALYFESFFQDASEEDKGAMNEALTELHVAAMGEKKSHAHTVAIILEKY